MWISIQSRWERGYCAIVLVTAYIHVQYMHTYTAELHINYICILPPTQGTSGPCILNIWDEVRTVLILRHHHTILLFSVIRTYDCPVSGLVPWRLWCTGRQRCGWIQNLSPRLLLCEVTPLQNGLYFLSLSLSLSLSLFVSNSCSFSPFFSSYFSLPWCPGMWMDSSICLM